MSKDENVQVVLVKANWCGHCKNFESIFDNTSKILKNNNKLKRVNLKSYDFADNEVKEQFEKEHGKVSQYIDGFPTVFVRKENKHDVKYTLIDTSHEDINIKEEDERLYGATNEFINNIENGLVTLNSQKGGNYECMLEQSLKDTLKENYYKKKYLKTKKDYLDLQKKMKM